MILSSLGSFLGSSSFQGGLGLAALGLGHHYNRKASKQAHRMRVLERLRNADYVRELERAREYNSPVEQVKRLREAGLPVGRNANAGIYGDVVLNTSQIPNPVSNPYEHGLDMLGNMGNIIRSQRDADFFSKIDRVSASLNIQRLNLENKILQKQYEDMSAPPEPVKKKLPIKEILRKVPIGKVQAYSDVVDYVINKSLGRPVTNNVTVSDALERYVGRYTRRRRKKG